jgi:hypothetical protein
MKDINFLPNSFLSRQRKRGDRVFFATIGIGTCCVIVSVSTLMYTMRQSVVHQSETLDAKLSESRDRQNEFANLKLRLAAQEEQAALLAYISQEWPVSRVLSEITEPLPSQIALLTLSYDRGGGKNGPAGNPFDSAQKNDAEAATTDSPFAADLKTLRGVIEDATWVITIKGETSDAAVLHLFVDKLNTSVLFDNVALEGFHASGDVDEQTRQFTLKLTVTAGHGQTNGQRYQPPPKTDAAEVPRET